MLNILHQEGLLLAKPTIIISSSPLHGLCSGGCLNESLKWTSPHFNVQAFHDGSVRVGAKRSCKRGNLPKRPKEPPRAHPSACAPKSCYFTTLSSPYHPPHLLGTRVRALLYYLIRPRPTSLRRPRLTERGGKSDRCNGFRKRFLRHPSYLR